MADKLIEVADGFWNVRGSFKVKGLLEIGTQTSLARLASGDFVMLDGYTLTGDVAKQVLKITDNGRLVTAILNLHPFHTIHVEAAASMFPQAKLYGTARHVEKAPHLNWEALRTEDPQLHDLFKEDFEFSVPRGVDFISSNENLHFSSVLAFHRASKTLHVDDTLTWTTLPMIGGLSFHLTLKQVLERRPGAVTDFRAWAEELATLCDGTKHLCTAHMRSLPPSAAEGASYGKQVRQALKKVEKILKVHEQRNGG